MDTCGACGHDTAEHVVRRDDGTEDALCCRCFVDAGFDPVPWHTGDGSCTDYAGCGVRGETMASQPVGTVGQRIRRRREEHGIRMAELARRVGISKSYLHQIETRPVGRPSAEVVYRLAVELATTPADLLGKTAAFDDAPTVTAELAAMARDNDLTDEDVAMLAAITYRGNRPQTYADYWYVFQAIARTIRD